MNVSFGSVIQGSARRTSVFLGCIWLFVSGVPDRAQSETTTDVPERFLVETGFFDMFISTNLTFNANSAINFENDLDLPGTVQRGYVEGFWRVARRHQLSLNYGRLDRTGDGVSLQRDINWGGVVYRAGVSAVGRTEADSISGAYRFAAYKNQQLEFGPSIGFGYIWLTAGITATADVSASGNTAANTLDREGHENTPTGDVGGFANWWVTKRVHLRSDLRYILVKPSDSEASVTQGRASLTWYPWRHLGFGGQYSYDKLRYDRNVLSTQLGGSYRYQGFHILASGAF